MVVHKKKVIFSFLFFIFALYILLSYFTLKDAHAKWVTYSSDGFNISCKKLIEEKSRLLKMLKPTIDIFI